MVDFGNELASQMVKEILDFSIDVEQDREAIIIKKIS